MQDREVKEVSVEPGQLIELALGEEIVLVRGAVPNSTPPENRCTRHHPDAIDRLIGALAFALSFMAIGGFIVFAVMR